jgi:Amt family ammonium transporter
MGDDYAGVFSSLNWTSVPLLAKFFFQLAFAATAGTIVSGCVAERIHYKAYMVFTLLLVGLSYPITGHWIWGGGWLAGMGFLDFAGSTVVHSVGGWAGLAGVLLLGPRLGKYKADGRVQPIQGHSMAMVFLGGLILWLGWFGFNPGSTMAVDPDAIAMIVVTTNMACAAALLSATLVSWLWLGSPDFTMTVNGALAGLVAITAPCAFVSVGASIIIGIVAGIIVVPSVVMFDKFRIDDPVGALSVHLVNGIWGTLALGLFHTADGLFYDGGVKLLTAQAIGVVAVGAFTMTVSLIVWSVVKMIFGLRVTETEERQGLDMSEMGMPAYGGDLSD